MDDRHRRGRRANAQIVPGNMRVAAVLRETLDAPDLGDDEDAWRTWYYDRLGYRYEPPDQITVAVDASPQLPPPTITDCFAAGTPVRTPEGRRPIESPQGRRPRRLPGRDDRRARLPADPGHPPRRARADLAARARHRRDDRHDPLPPLLARRPGLGDGPRRSSPATRSAPWPAAADRRHLRGPPCRSSTWTSPASGPSSSAGPTPSSTTTRRPRRTGRRLMRTCLDMVTFMKAKASSQVVPVRFQPSALRDDRVAPPADNRANGPDAVATGRWSHRGETMPRFAVILPAAGVRRGSATRSRRRSTPSSTAARSGSAPSSRS